jgi:hypothetical protein
LTFTHRYHTPKQANPHEEIFRAKPVDKPKNPFDKQSNNETKQLAENIRAKRQIEIQAGNYGFLNTKLKAETDFVQYFKQIVEAKTGGNKNGWQQRSITLKCSQGAN